MSRRIIIAAVVFLPILIGMLLLGIAAYRGRWHSWHGNNTFFTWRYAPLAGAWFAAAGLLIVLALASSPNTSTGPAGPSSPGPPRPPLCQDQIMKAGPHLLRSGRGRRSVRG